MSRKIKIGEQLTCSQYGTTRKPLIRLKGKWLERMGFPIGSHIQINVYAQGCADIRVIQPEGKP